MVLLYRGMITIRNWQYVLSGRNHAHASMKASNKTAAELVHLAGRRQRQFQV
jgi:hypothetical protein